MIKQDVFPYRVEFSELTPAQYEAGVNWLQENGVSYEDHSGDGRTDMLRTVQASEEQNVELQGVLEATS